MIESSKRLAPWRSTVALAAQAAHLERGLLEGPLVVTCRFVFPRPKSHRRANGELRESAPWRHSSRPDVDKLVRAVLDGITGVVLADDAQVAELRATKEYGDEPGAEVMVMLGRAA